LVTWDVIPSKYGNIATFMFFSPKKFLCTLVHWIYFLLLQRRIFPPIIFLLNKETLIQIGFKTENLLRNPLPITRFIASQVQLPFFKTLALLEMHRGLFSFPWIPHQPCFLLAICWESGEAKKNIFKKIENKVTFSIFNHQTSNK